MCTIYIIHYAYYTLYNIYHTLCILYIVQLHGIQIYLHIIISFIVVQYVL